MKIMYIVESAGPYGANKSLIDLIDYTRAHNVTSFVVGADNGPLADWLESRGVFFKALGHKLSVYPKHNKATNKIRYIVKLLGMRVLNLVALMRLVFICLKLRPDIIHTNVGPCSIGYWCAYILRIKHVWHLREYQDLDFDLKFFPSKKHFIELLKKSNFNICITHAIAKHFSSPGNFKVINDGVASENDYYFDSEKEDYFLFAGRLEPTKGIEEAISAYLRFCKKYSASHEFLVAGDGDDAYVNQLMQGVKGSEYGRGIKFLGYRSDTLSLMRKAKALIVASRSEGFGRITPEAMFNGCLVIGKNKGGTAEILGADEVDRIGLMFDEEDSLVERINEAVQLSSADYQDIVRRAQAKAINKYCIELHGREVHAVYNALLNK